MSDDQTTKNLLAMYDIAKQHTANRLRSVADKIEEETESDRGNRRDATEKQSTAGDSTNAT
jgi:hypothetical protein